MATKFVSLIRWTRMEDDLIRKRYPVGGIDACIGGLRRNKRSGAAIYGRARKLGLVENRMRATIMEECAKIADLAHQQDIINNGASATGAAKYVADAIRAMIPAQHS